MDDLERQLGEMPAPEEGGHCPIDLIRRYRDFIVAHAVTDPAQAPVFSGRYPALFRVISTGAPSEVLDLFLHRMERIQQGHEDQMQVEKDLAKVLHERYVVPKIMGSQNDCERTVYK